MRIVFVLSFLPNPRMYKRIRALKEDNDVAVVCIKRSNQDVFTKQDIPGVDHYIESKDMPPAIQLLRRMKASRGVKSFIVGKLNDLQPDVIYTSGLDNLIAIYDYASRHKTHVVYEVADLRESYLEDTNKTILQRFVDAQICRSERKKFDCVDLLVLTSMKFYDAHYNAFVPIDKVINIPNMPELAAFDKYCRKQERHPFVLGFIGGIRYMDQMYMMVDAAKEAGVQLVVAGASVDDHSDFIDYCKKQSHVKLLGKYDYAKDIAGLYGMTDAIYSVYDADNANVRIALPNKLYESVYCGLPIIVAKNTYLSELVSDWGVGVAVSHKDKTELVAILRRLKNEDEYYNSFVNNCKKKKGEMNIGIYLNDLRNRIKSLE